MRFLAALATLTATAVLGVASAADSYALPNGYYYLDPVGAKTYTDNSLPEMVILQQINASVGDSFDAWIQRLWIAGFGGSYEISPGTGRGFVGHTHLVPSINNSQEQIKPAGIPSRVRHLALSPASSTKCFSDQASCWTTTLALFASFPMGPDRGRVDHQAKDLEHQHDHVAQQRNAAGVHREPRRCRARQFREEL